MEHHYTECIACDVTVCIRCSCPCALLSVIGHIFHFFVMASVTTRIYAMLGVNLHLELKNATTHSQKTGSSQIYGLKRARDQMVSTPIQLECAVFILVTP